VSTTAIGLTGAFGSGCTTASLTLRDDRRFEHVRLSDGIRDKWKEIHGPDANPTRSELQQLGDQLRQDSNPSILIDMAIDRVNREQKTQPLAIDGIRNVAEIERLKEIYGYQFTLVAVLSSTEARWERIKSTAYLGQGLSQADFARDDARDRNEETTWGQQVELCIDNADIIIDNSEDVTLNRFKSKVREFADLSTRKKTRSATSHEIRMHMAYAASHSSKCLKRHVGAVLINQDGNLIASGYNENPQMTKPCAEEKDYEFQCFRDIVRNSHFEKLSIDKAKCPHCGEQLPIIKGPPWICPKCKEKGQKTNLESFFFPDRAMNWCTAVHSEIWAVLAAGDRARSATLYVTTFPCMQCAEKIAQAGVRAVWYTEAYPDPHGIDRLKLAKVEVKRFEGVRSSAFERIFSSSKPS